MRRLLLLCVVAVALPLSAQQSPEKPFRLSLLASDVSYTESDSSGRNLDSGLILGFQYSFSPRWSAEASYTREQHHWGQRTIVGPEVIAIDNVNVTSEPIELVGQFNFLTDVRWKPYLGFGARYVGTPSDDPDRNDAVVAPILTGGVHFQLTPSFSIRAEGKAKLGEDRYYDETFKTAIGIGYRF